MTGSRSDSGRHSSVADPPRPRRPPTSLAANRPRRGRGGRPRTEPTSAAASPPTWSVSGVIGPSHDQLVTLGLAPTFLDAIGATARPPARGRAGRTSRFDPRPGRCGLMLGMFDLDRDQPITVAEARRLAGCAQGTILAAIRRGDLDARKVSSTRTAPYLLLERQVVKWAEARKARRNVATA
ncbi:helix-turn-helix DNA binding domain protein [Gordonia phage Schiebs]|nr:helix-turn-helix DNA binding domain protein [Gordonia phage Schiebs]